MIHLNRQSNKSFTGAARSYRKRADSLVQSPKRTMLLSLSRARKDRSGRCSGYRVTLEANQRAEAFSSAMRDDIAEDFIPAVLSTAEFSSRDRLERPWPPLDKVQRPNASSPTKRHSKIILLLSPVSLPAPTPPLFPPRGDKDPGRSQSQIDNKKCPINPEERRG